MAIEKDLLDQLLAGRDPKDVFNKDGLVDELKKALLRLTNIWTATAAKPKATTATPADRARRCHCIHRHPKTCTKPVMAHDFSLHCI